MRSILTAASVASAKADMDNAATSYTMLVLLDFAVVAIFAAGVALGAALSTRVTRASAEVQHKEKALAAERDERARQAGRAAKGGQEVAENAQGIFMSKYHYTACSRLLIDMFSARTSATPSTSLGWMLEFRI